MFVSVPISPTCRAGTRRSVRVMSGQVVYCFMFVSVPISPTCRAGTRRSGRVMSGQVVYCSMFVSVPISPTCRAGTQRSSWVMSCQVRSYIVLCLFQFPYHLHAVLVHEGQAVSGHYWAYIFDTTRNKWLKFNDITVSESCWEELERESIGGYHNASAYCLMYVDRSKIQSPDTSIDVAGIPAGDGELSPLVMCTPCRV